MTLPITFIDHIQGKEAVFIIFYYTSLPWAYMSEFEPIRATFLLIF